MPQRTEADQVRQEHISKLGPELGPLYHALWESQAALQVDWQEYKEMFGTDPQRIDLMNQAAGLFFRIVQDTLWEAILLHLTRLTDRARSAGKTNLTLMALPEAISDGALRAQVSALADDAKRGTAFARDWRNRHISHRDLELALRSGQPIPPAQPLEPVSRRQVSEAVSAIHAVLNHISERLLHSSLADRVITPGTGSIALLAVIRAGIEARQAARERLRKGQFVPEEAAPGSTPCAQSETG
jgi:hypothetical protein